MLFSSVSAKEQAFSVSLQDTNLPDAIRYIAKLLDINVIISRAVQGKAVLNLNHVDPHDALNMLLTSHGLAKSRSGNIWLIAPQDELVALKEKEIKWLELDENAAPLASDIGQMKYAKAEDVARIISDERASFLSKRGRIRVDVRTNTICIQDVLPRLTAIRRLIHRLDVPVQQISIAAKLVSIDSDCEQELGVKFSVKPVIDTSDQNGSYSLAVAKLADGSLLDIKLLALENQGRAELISSPSLFAANQQAASIEAGEEVPYQEVSESGGTAVVFKKAVLGLKVVPQILPQKNILLQLHINQDRPSNKMVQGMPTISTRQIKTSVLVKSGQTIVLGGIYEMNTESGESGIPLLSRIPGLGVLFKQQHNRNNKRELLIFVTPNIIG